MSIPYFDRYLAGLRSFGPWLTWRGATCAAGLGFACGTLLIQFGCFPQHEPQAGETIYPYWQLAYLIGFPFVGFLSWAIASQGYLRSGHGVKIGVAYDGYKVDVSDWKRTRATLAQLFKSKRIKGRVSLRFIPESRTVTEEVTNKFMRRYHFAMITRLRSSPENKTKVRDGRRAITEYIQFTVGSHEYIDFLKTTFPAGLEISRKLPTNLIDVLDAKAHTFHDALMLFVGSLLYFKGEYEDAAVILRYLDSHLTDFSTDQPPRIQVRFLDMRARLARTRFSAAAVPDYDTMNGARQHAETALCYFDQFPDVAVSLARIRFLVGDLDGAIALTTQFSETVQACRERGQHIVELISAQLQVNLGFLSFVQGYWNKAARAYNDVFRDGEHKHLNWVELTQFIDYVAELERYDGIAFLQVLYRKVAGAKISHTLLRAAQNWVQADSSRAQLKPLIYRSYNKPTPGKGGSRRSRKAAKKGR